MEPRRVVLLAAQDAQSLDIFGPIEVLDAASRLGERPYAIELVTPGGGPLRLSNGLTVLGSPLPAPRPCDTLMVAGGDGARRAVGDPEVVAWIAAQAALARRTTGVCTASFLLAAAGLLDGRRATTHWAYCDRLAERHPATTVEADPIFVRDGDIWTSAGVTAGMDLTLALVEEDLGREVALECARWLVLFLKRPGGQSQFSSGLAVQLAERRPLRELQAWIADHLSHDLTVPTLAARAHMSERNLGRAFRRETGMTPAAYVEALRVERARVLLESTREPLEAIARATGFASAEVLRRAFHRRLHVGPSAYRDRFRAAA